MKIGGLLLCFAGMALLCAMDAVAKALGAHLTTFQIAFVRYGGAAAWLALYIALARTAWPSPRNWRRHAMRGLLMVTTACLFFYAVTHLPLAIATALAMSAPIYVSLFGIVFFRERPSRMLGVAIGLGIAGSAIMVIGSDGGVSSGDLSGWIAGLLAPITYAAAIVLLKHHAGDESAGALSLSTAAIAAVVLIPVAVPDLVPPDASVWPLMVLIGLLGAAGFVLLTIGLRTTPASTFAIVDYMSLLWAALFGFIFFAEVPQPRFWIGGALIVSACALCLRATSRGGPVPGRPSPSAP